MTPSTGKLQRFIDTNHGFTATIRRTKDGFVLRVRQDNGLLRYCESLWSATAAKTTLESLLIVTPECPTGLRGNWWTVAGYVSDDNETAEDRARMDSDKTIPWWDQADPDEVSA